MDKTEASNAVANPAPGMGVFCAKVPWELVNQIRQESLVRGIDSYEDKSWFSSFFVFYGQAVSTGNFYKDLQDLNRIRLENKKNSR